MPPEPKVERVLPEFTVKCYYCDMKFASIETMVSHRDYWHLEKEKEDNG